MTTKRSVNLTYDKIEGVLCVLVSVTLIWMLYLIIGEIWSAVWQIPIPFDTDEADHANAGWELYWTLKNSSIGEIFSSITRQAFYPPLHSVFVAISYFMYGPSIPSSRISSSLFFVCSIPLTGFAVWLIAKRAGASFIPAFLGALWSMLCVVGSPILISNSTLCMLEMPGVFISSLMALLMALHRWRAATISLFFLFITKYSFAVFLAPGFFFALLMYSYATSSYRLTIESCILFSILCLSWIFLSDPYSFYGFLVGHPSYAPILSKENLLFEIMAWTNEYSPTKLLAGVITVLAVVGATGSSKYAVKIGFSSVILFALLLLILSTTNESRHFFVVAPYVWILSGLGISYLSQNLKPRYISLLVSISLLFWGLMALHGLTDGVRKSIANQMEGRPGYSILVDEIISNVDSTSPVLFIGLFDQFGVEMLRWRGSVASNLPYTKTRFDTYPFRDDKNETAKKRKRNLDSPYYLDNIPKAPLKRILDTGYYSSVVTLRRVGQKNRAAVAIEEVKSLDLPLLSLKSSDGLEIAIYKGASR